MISSHVIEQSGEFQEWRQTFREAVGIDVHLLDSEYLGSGMCQAAAGVELCRLISSRCDRCAESRHCFAKRLRAGDHNHAEPSTMHCFAGLTVSAMPVPLADHTTVFLTTSPILLCNGNRHSAWEGTVRHVVAACSNLSAHEANSPARALPVHDRRQFKAAIALIRLLAEHLAHLSRQMLANPDHDWHDVIAVRRSRKLIDLRFSENLHLDEVAAEVGVSHSYLSHAFKKQTGLSFTDYIAGRRVAELKRLLTDSDLTITEALFAAGFQSVSQGNRVFRATTGMAPRDFLASLAE